MFIPPHDSGIGGSCTPSSMSRMHFLLSNFRSLVSRKHWEWGLPFLLTHFASFVFEPLQSSWDRPYSARCPKAIPVRNFCLEMFSSLIVFFFLHLLVTLKVSSLPQIPLYLRKSHVSDASTPPLTQPGQDPTVWLNQRHSVGDNYASSSTTESGRGAHRPVLCLVNYLAKVIGIIGMSNSLSLSDHTYDIQNIYV